MLPLSIAPMLDRTDRHFRWFFRGITRHAMLYTEMVTVGALLNGDRERHLGFDPEEGPIALQLGGDDPVQLAACARMAWDAGYDEVNLNVGCPSPRVQQGNFGACLMTTPHVVAEAVAAMRAVVPIPVTVKHRIGVDDVDRYEDMLRFVDIVAEAGCTDFIVHARKAWLSGLSPKQNRDVPPLRHDEVHRLKRERPTLCVATNGGIRTFARIREELAHVDSVMIGRAACDDPWMLIETDPALFGASAPSATREEAALRVIPHLETLERRGEPARRVLRHMLELFSGIPGARAWRRLLTTPGIDGKTAILEGLAGLEAARERGVA